MIKQWQELYYHQINSDKQVDDVAVVAKDSLARIVEDSKREVSHVQKLEGDKISGPVGWNLPKDSNLCKICLQKGTPQAAEQQVTSTCSCLTQKYKTLQPRWMMGTRGQIGLVPGNAKEGDTICHSEIHALP